jgi:hypothetical protein
MQGLIGLMFVLWLFVNDRPQSRKHLVANRPHRNRQKERVFKNLPFEMQIYNSVDRGKLLLAYNN